MTESASLVSVSVRITAAAAALLALGVALSSCGDVEEEVGPGAAATASPTPTDPAAPTPLPATATLGLAPSSTPLPLTAMYKDPINGFVISYPAAWYVSAPPPDPSILGYAITISSYNIEKARGIGVAPPQNELKIDIGVEPNPAGLSVDDWVMQQAVSVVSVKQTVLAGEPALQRLVSTSDGVKISGYFFAHGSNMYSISAYTAESILISTFDAIAASLRFES